jgi:hypothetical protein
MVGVFPGTPINDDWAYARILEEFVRTGRFIPLGWIGMNQNLRNKNLLWASEVDP